VRERIERACDRAGRSPAEVRLVAVSKTVAVPALREALEAGQTLFGENRVQEALSKMPEIGPAATWHLVGSLQRNKARHAVGAFELIHSVDDLALARELDRRAGAAGLRQAVLVQLNLAGEATKSGVGESDLWPLVARIDELPHLELRGLMTIPPPASPEETRRWFRHLRETRERAEDSLGRALAELSMGMTDDFEVAIEEGATLVRVGRAIFGERPAP
jgi:pyridoxal phosphate enzyme (YggS family)